MKSFINNEKIKILIIGQGEYFTDAICGENGIIMIPAREFFEEMGAGVEWREDEKVVISRMEEDVFFVRCGLEGVVLKGKLIPISVAPCIIDNIVYIPTDVIEKGFGATVKWFKEAGTLCVWKKKKDPKIPQLTVPETKTIEEIWEIDIKENFVAEMSFYLAKKCNYGKDIEKLNNEQKVLYIAQELEGEVNNGGFDQFFFNTGGNFATELPRVFNEIGAVKTARICIRAMGAFGGKVPTDRFERQEVMETFGEDVSELFNECDNDFYKYEDDLLELNYQYIIKNKKSFLN